MTWLRLDDDYASDGTIRRCRAVQWWPLILCAMKRGGGVATDDDLSPEVLADIGQGDEEAAARAVDRLKAAGRIVQVEGGWTIPGWYDLQRETTSTERVRRHRERAKRDETHETVSPVSSEQEKRVERTTVRYVTEHNGTGVLVEVDGTTSRARVEPSQLPPPPPPDGLGAVVEAFRRTQSGRQAMQVSPATVASLATMVTAHGHEAMVEAIRRASERCQGDLTIAYLRPVVAAVAAGEPEQRGRRVERKPSAAYQSEEPVASPRVVTEGLL